jgi:calmodulin
MNAFTEDEVEEVKEAFSIYGDQAQWTIPTTVFGTVLRALGLNPTETELRELSKIADPDASGYVELNAFLVALYKKKQDSDTFPELMEAFKIFDPVNTGTIRVPEFRYVMSCLGEKIPEDDVDDIIKAADPENLGEVKYEEFAKKIWDKETA